MRPRTRLAGLSLLSAILVLVLFLPTAVDRIVDWYWFDNLGYGRVFLTVLDTRFLLGLFTALLAAAFLVLNLRWALRHPAPDPTRVRAPKVFPNLPGSPERVKRWATWGVLLLAALVGLVVSARWLDVQQFLHRTPFGVTDPVFGRDVGYYVFTVPILSLASGVLFVLTMLVLVAMVLPISMIRGTVVLAPRAVSIKAAAGMQLAILVALLFVVLAFQLHFVRAPELLHSTTGPLVGASYVDLHVRLPGIHVATVTALLSAALVLWGIPRRRVFRNTIIAVAFYVVVAAVGTALLPAMVERLVVKPNELVKETPQLTWHIAATRRAWGLDSIAVHDLSGETQLTAGDIAQEEATIRNIRLWDRDLLLQTFGQIQSIRTYYHFINVDDDRYWIDGAYRQVLLSARELDPTSLPQRSFINERLTFTHGMGLTMSPVNQVGSEGLPTLFVQDLPPVSNVSLHITRPEIYFGELADGYVIAATKQPEFDYPAGREGQDIYASYEGRGGVSASGFIRRLLLAMRFGSLNILLSDDITPRSRILFHREILGRAQRLLPFLDFDQDPYMVITNAGRLMWILDGYTSTKRYPYAMPTADGTTYVRNAAKVVIDAYDGTVTAYLADPHDPLALTAARIFPGVLHPMSEMPADLRAHLRYPGTLFQLQTMMYATYHMSEPATFYHREDQWQVPRQTHERDQSVEAYTRHMIMRLPGERSAEYILMTPFTPRAKDNLAAWVVARNDGEHYGDLAAYRFPKQSLVFGPAQITNRIDQNTEISQQLSLWDQRGSQVLRGDLLVIPIGESLLYVQPLYLRAQGGEIPELKRVIIAYQNTVVMEPTLAEGLARIFGGNAAGAQTAPSGEERPAAAEAAPAAAPLSPRAATLVTQAEEHYRRAMEAQRAGDWATYGAEITRVGELLRQLRAQQSSPALPDSSRRTP
ncbi:MAG TPA: UPF0182 family protein [Gemmatimonadaceae bacterium]|nr:UPF0182 family protein [Gemmatimonadaceae bacterium]